MIYDVVIVGGGAAGYGCALTLTSVERTKEFGKNRNYLMIDNGNSDILKARFFNLSGVEYGIGGDELLEKMKSQLAEFESCQFLEDTVTKITKADETFKVQTSNKTLEANTVVIATGMHKFDIEVEGFEVQIEEHTDVPKPGKICLKNENNVIVKNLYVAGLASGAKTMFAIANGEGSKVACQIFKEWTGRPMVAHDSIRQK